MRSNLNRGYGKHATTGFLERPGTIANKRRICLSTDGQPARERDEAFVVEINLNKAHPARNLKHENMKSYYDERDNSS